MSDFPRSILCRYILLSQLDLTIHWIMSFPQDYAWYLPINHIYLTSYYFSMNLQLLSSLACGGVLQSDSGVITSPNYPNNYDHDMGCAWEIIAEEGAQIEVNESLVFIQILFLDSIYPCIEWVSFIKYKKISKKCWFCRSQWTNLL